MSDFRFEPISFVIGLVAGLVISLFLYRARYLLGRMRRDATTRAESARRYATRTADARYTIDMQRYCQQYHIASDLADLSDIVIEPRFLRGVNTFDTTGERHMRDVFHVLPTIHRFPASYAPYNVHTLGIADLEYADRHLALLGQPGSGRSTALAAIALWAMQEIEFEEAEDLVQTAIDLEEAELEPEERELHRQKQADIQARAMAQIEQAQEQATTARGEEGDVRERAEFARLMPMLVHFSDIIIDTETDTRIDPAEPLVRAVQQNLRRVTSFTVPRYIYNRLNSGQALVLLDGLDDLPAHEQPAKLAWLNRFLDTYDACFVIVAGPATGYHTLLDSGLTPTFLRPWMDRDAQQAADKWAAIWPKATGTRRKPGTEIDERTLGIIAKETRGLNALDTTARIITSYQRQEEDVELLTRWDWYSNLFARNFHTPEFDKDDELIDDANYFMAELAARSIQEGPISAEALRTQLEATMLIADGKRDPSYRVNINKFIKMLISSGLLIERAGDFFDFAHPQLAAFLASITVLDMEGAHHLAELVHNPDWQGVIPFAVAQAEPSIVNQAVVNKLSGQPGLLFENLFEIANWLPNAPEDAQWRGEIYKRFTAALLAPSQFPIVRSYAMAALVAAHDDNVLFILRQALRSTDAPVRQLGCIGIGAIGSPDAIRDLRPMLEDDALEVQLAAGLAMGAIGSDRAIEAMVEELLSGEESLRQAIAEALAAIPGEGHKILHTAATSEDMMVRRAAMFGLARVGTPWALTDIYRQLLEDEQWYVRSAAEEIFATVQGDEQIVATAHPPIEALEWVQDWVEEQGEDTPELEDPVEILIHMMDVGNQAYRIASARTLGYLGYLPAVPALYQLLNDGEASVRTAGFDALADVQTILPKQMPGIN